MNLIPDSGVRDSYRQAFTDLHETFARPITVWKTPVETVISNDPNYNGFYPTEGENVQLTRESGVFSATIKYLTAQEMEREIAALARADAAKINVNAGGVRIRLNASGYAFMKDVEDVVFDNESHVIVSNARPKGLFGPQFYDFILQRTS